MFTEPAFGAVVLGPFVRHADALAAESEAWQLALGRQPDSNEDVGVAFLVEELMTPSGTVAGDPSSGRE
jgi:hypothetical protein